MLSTEPEKTRRIVLSEKPAMKEDVFRYDSKFLNVMICNLAKVSSTFHKNPEDIYKNHVEEYITYFFIVYLINITEKYFVLKRDLTYVEEENNKESKQIEEKSTTIHKLKSPLVEKNVSKLNDLLETEDKTQTKPNENQNYLFDLIDLQTDNNEKKGQGNNDLLDFADVIDPPSKTNFSTQHDLVNYLSLSSLNN